MDPELKKLFDELQTTVAQFRAANDAALAEKADKKSVDVILSEKVDKINAEITALEKRVQAKQDELFKSLHRPQRGDGPEIDQEHRKAFFDYVKKGEVSQALERKTGSVGSNTDGGYLVSEEVEAGIDRLAERMTSMRSICTVRPISKPSYTKVVQTGGASAGGWGNENTAPSTTAGPTLSELKFTTGTLWAEPKATRELLEDSDVNIESWYMDEVSLIFAETENSKFISGDGVDKPKGFLSYTIVANASWAWNKIGYIKTGAAASFHATLPQDNLVNLYHALKPKYRSNAVFLMNDATLALVRMFKDGDNRYLWEPDYKAGPSGIVIGQRVVTDDDMPDVGADTYPVAYGDFKRGYVIVDRRGLTVVRDELTAKPYVKLYTSKRVGGGVQHFEAIKILKCEA